MRHASRELIRDTRRTIAIPFVFRGSPRYGRAAGFRKVEESEIARFKGFHGDRVRLAGTELRDAEGASGEGREERGAGTTN